MAEVGTYTEANEDPVIESASELNRNAFVMLQCITSNHPHFGEM